ncbi:MAG: ABC transporter permease [Thermomicrobiales bacterium]|nr:ABC transporter permease [Thermomicrobiales bacterium]
MTGNLLSAWLDVRSKPLRTLAAIAGMAAAIVAVVLVDAASVLSREANDVYLARRYGRVVTLSIYSESGLSGAEDAARLESVLRDNGIWALSSDFTAPAFVSWQSAEVSRGVRILNPEFADVHIVDIVAGAWPEETATGEVSHAVVTAGWANQMLGLSDQQIVGMTFDYHTMFDVVADLRSIPVHPIVVDGVVATGTSAFPAGTSALSIVTRTPPADLMTSMVVPSWVARVNPGQVGFVQELVAMVTDDTGRPIFRAMRADQGDQLAPVLDQQDVTARIVSIVALTIGGLGILGVGIASVRERAREFGLRRALGASTVRVFTGVIVQTLMEVLIAALIAIPLAALLVAFFARQMVLDELPLPPSTSLPISSALIGLAGALIVGVIAGLIPAVNAARTSVVQALRG